MKKVLAAGLIIFFTGFILKFFHVHFHAIIMIVGLVIGIIAQTAISFQKEDDKLSKMISWASICWLLLLLFTVKFWVYSYIFLFIAAALTFVAAADAMKEKRLIQFKLLALTCILSMIFYIMPTHERYYLMSIKFNYEIETDYYSWDKYSWFLYNNQKYEEALEASDKAVSLVQRGRPI